MLGKKRGNMLRLIQLLPFILVGIARAASKQERESFPEFAQLLDGYNYDWETKQVKTADGWHLTLFHLIGVKGRDQKVHAEWNLHESAQYPLLVLHGAYDSAYGVLSRGIFDKPWILKIVDQGFDVWLYNARGI